MRNKIVFIILFFITLGSAFVTIIILRQRDLSTEDTSANISGSTAVQPLNTNYVLGAYYMPKPEYPTHQWYDLKVFNRLQSTENVNQIRKPLLGFYDGSNVEAMNYKIKWAAEAGISYWVFNDFWTISGSNSSYRTDINAFLSSPNKNYLQFAMMITSVAPETDATSVATKLNSDVANIYKNTYLNQPNYLRFDGKPVIYILNVDTIADSADTPQTVNQRLINFEQALGQDIFFVYAGHGYDANSVTVLKQYGFDALSPYYVIPGITYPPFNTNPVVYSQMVSQAINANSSLQQAANQAGMKFIPTSTTNFDERPRYDIDTFLSPRQYSTDHNINDYTRYLQGVKSLADNNASSILKVNDKPVVGLGAYNEWVEDAQIEPGVSSLNPNEPFKVINAVASVYMPGFVPNSSQQESVADLTPAVSIGKTSWNLGSPSDVSLIYLNPNATKITSAATGDYGSFTVNNSPGGNTFFDIAANVDLTNYEGVRIAFVATCPGDSCTASIQTTWYTTTCTGDTSSTCTDKANSVRTGGTGSVLANCVNKPNDQTWGYCDLKPQPGDSTWSGKLEQLRVIFYLNNITPINYAISTVELIQKTTTTPPPANSCGLCGPLDRNGSGDFDILDIVAMSANGTFGYTCQNINYSGASECNECGSMDVNKDGKIDILDFANIAIRDNNGNITDSIFKRTCSQIKALGR